jgi:lysophospholipase
MLKLTIAFLAIAIASINAFAIPEAQVASKFMSEILPYMKSNYTRSQFEGAGGLKINYFYRQVENPKGVIIVTPGQGEASLKYAELLYDMKDWGYSIYIIDHRGQGLSDKTLPGTTRSHVRKFEHYIQDYTKFVTEIVHPENYRHSMIVAHSMGGAIASGFLQQNPTAVKAAVLSAPMIEINTGKWGPILASLFSNLLNFAGKSTDLAPGQSPYVANAPFANNMVTSSEARHQAKVSLYNAMPEMAVGGATVSWVKESLNFTTALRQKDSVYSVPTRIFQGGRDELVMPRGHNQICALSRAVCGIVKFPEAQHEILMEKDSIRNSALATIKSFLQETANQ